MSVPVSALQAVAPGAIIELFELELNAAQHGVNETYRFHAGVNATGNNGDIIWAGNPYMRFPLEAEGFEYSGQGQLPRPKLRISNIFGTITAVILTLPNGLEGAKVKAAAAKTDPDKRTYNSAVASWTSAIRAYGSKIRSIETDIKRLEAAKLAAQNKPAELAINVADSRDTAKLICTTGL